MVLRKFWISFLPLCVNAGLVSDSDYASMPPIFHIDDYDNCMLYGNESLFCGIGFRLTPRRPEYTSQVWKTIHTLTKSKKYYNHDLLRHGVCVKKACPEIRFSKYEINNVTMENTEFIQDLEDCYSRKFEDVDLKGKIKFIRCQISQSRYDINIFDYLFCGFLIIFISLVLYASANDLFFEVKFQNDTIFEKYISTFSLVQNWKRLIKVDLEHPDSKALSSIQGVRLFNLTGVIFCHSGLFNVSLPILNPRYVEAMMDRKFEQFIGMGGRHTTLQSFFLMSSFLQTYKFFDKFQGKQNVPFSYLIRSFFSRYFRLTPMVAIVTIFFATLVPHLARGPLWDYVVGDEYRMCRSQWWYNLVYLNNFLPLHGMCLPHLWSLSVDLQFHAFGLVILWLMWNYENKTAWILGSVGLYHVHQTFFSFYKKVRFTSVNPEMTYNTTLVNLNEFLQLYKATTTNMAGLIWGLAFGYLFYKCRNKQLFTKKGHILMWWIVSLSSLILVTIFPGFYVNFGVGGPYSDLIFAIYMALSRSIFSFGIGLFIFGMTQGQGHVIKEFCEWPVIYVLGRLNFNAYLVHVCIQRFVAGLKRTPNFLSDYLIVFDSLSYLAVSYMAAAFLTLFFEYPFVEMKKHITDFLKKNFMESEKKTN